MSDYTGKTSKSSSWTSGVVIRGARQNNLKNINLSLPRDSIVVFTGVSGSGKSSLAFGTLYAESQRRYLESVAPYARRLINQLEAPEVDVLEGLPPAVALQQQQGVGGARSDVATTTTLSSVVRMLYSRAGVYPPGQKKLLAEDFSPHTVEGACPRCHGLGMIYDVSESLMVPDPSRTLRERAIAAWPTGWSGLNLLRIVTALGYDIDIPWSQLPQKQRDWILYTDERPTVGVYPDLSLKQVRRARKAGVEPDYHGTFVGARRHVLDTFANTKSAAMKRRASNFLTGQTCPTCSGRRLKPEALSVTFDGLDISGFYRLPLTEVQARANRIVALLSNPSHGTSEDQACASEVSAKAAAVRLLSELITRLKPILALGLGYLSLDRGTRTLSGGEWQRLRLATQLSSKLFGVAYVLDEPSAGLHPKDIGALNAILHDLKKTGNSVFLVEHNPAVIAQADWLVDLGPLAGERGGRVIYSGPPQGLSCADESQTRKYLSNSLVQRSSQVRRKSADHLHFAQVSCNTVSSAEFSVPVGCLTAVTGVSGAGKSSLVSQAIPAILRDYWGQKVRQTLDEDAAEFPFAEFGGSKSSGRAANVPPSIRRVSVIDQQPIGRTSRSNIATYTGVFDQVRKLFARTPEANSAGLKASEFSFNVPGGRCPRCQGEGSVTVELLFLPSVHSPCPECHGSRYQDRVLEVKWNGLSVADVLDLTVEDARVVFGSDARIARGLNALESVGLGYLRLGQPATELSGGEAQRVKLATELQRASQGDTLYILDEPTSGLHPADSDRIMAHIQDLVDQGNTVLMAELDMRIVAMADYVIEMGPGPGVEGGRIVFTGTPEEIARESSSTTATFLRSYII